MSERTCQGFEIVDASYGSNQFLSQETHMWRLAFGVASQCDSSVLEAAPDNFPCYDMASSLSGDFVADGEVNVFDLSLQIRMLFGGIDMADSYMRLSDTTLWKYESAADCSRRDRQMAASITKASARSDFYAGCTLMQMRHRYTSACTALHLWS